MGFLIGVGAFLRSGPGKIVMWVLLALSVLLFVNRMGHASGVRACNAHHAKAQAAAMVAIQRSEARAAQISTKAQADLAQARAQITVRTETITKRVPVYVTREGNARCTVPAGFVRLFNNAAEGGEASLPPAPGRSVDAPSGVDLSTVADTTAHNFGTAYGWREEALTWRRWYADQKAAWDKR